jgi:hypothetical protein
MGETTKTDAAGGGGEGQVGQTSRHEEATSGETLADLEQAQADKSPGKGGSTETGSPTETSSPAPDGQSDSARGGRSDGGDTGGPM